MKKLTILVPLMCISIFFTYSCQRVPAPSQTLTTTNLTSLKNIPLEYGSLIAVTTHTQYPGWAQLWFEDDDRNIHIIRVDSVNNILRKDVTIIPRD